jgi:hypothetical protein
VTPRRPSPKLLFGCFVALIAVGIAVGIAIGASSGSRALPPPRFGQSVDIGLVSGVVIVRPISGPSFRLGAEDRNILVGSEIDTSRGEVDLRSAGGKPSATVQDGQFRGGLFKVLQRRSQLGLTVVDLMVTSNAQHTCAAASASATASRRLSKQVLALLAARVRGKFRTRGRYSAGTVRGTAWDTIERCDGTLTRVHSGVVLVRDFRLGRTIAVPAGHSYLALAP